MTVRANEIAAGQFFRKRRGTYVYMRISASAVRYLQLPADKVYGVCFNGNVAAVAPDTRITPCTVADFAQNIEDDRAWHRQVGARGNVDDPYELDK